MVKVVCKECGYQTIYAKGLCRNCYARKLRSGSSKRKERKTEPSEKQQKILDLYNETKNVLKTANAIGCSRAYVYALLREYKKITNADRIRSMTDEELADWLIMNGNGTDYETWLNWLKQEVKEKTRAAMHGGA